MKASFLSDQRIQLELSRDDFSTLRASLFEARRLSGDFHVRTGATLEEADLLLSVMDAVERDFDETFRMERERI